MKETGKEKTGFPKNKNKKGKAAKQRSRRTGRGAHVVKVSHAPEARGTGGTLLVPGILDEAAPLAHVRI